MAMSAVGVKNWRTYSSALNDLEEWGFISFIERSKNQYSANIISLSACVKNTIAPTKALDKAMQRHLQKHCTKHSQSTVVINKQVTSKQVTSKQRVIDKKLREDLFETFWNKYPRKTGKAVAKKSWMKIKNIESVSVEIEKALSWQVETSQWKDDPRFIPYPSTYLNQERWLDEKEEQVKKESYITKI